MCSSQTLCSESFFPKAVRSDKPDAHAFQCMFQQADQAHTVMNTSWSQPVLGNFKPPAFAQYYIIGWHYSILECDIRVVMGASS